MRTPIARLAAAAAAMVAACTSSNPTSPVSATSNLPQAAGTFAEAAGLKLSYPARVAPAADGTLFVSDAVANQVLGLKGNAAVVAVTGIPKPLGVAVSGTTLYVGSAGRKTVESYDLANRKAGWALSGFDMPNGIAVGPDGNIFVADSKKDHLTVLAPDGRVLREIGADLNFPVAVAVDAARIVVADQGNHRVVVYSPAGAQVRAFGGEVTSAKCLDDYRGKFTSLGSVALSGSEILALDSAHSFVQAFDAAGTPAGIFGYAGSCATCTRLALAIAVAPDGSVLATDPEQHRVVSLSTERR